MAYHLLTYSLIFLPVVIALYQLCPARFRFVVLLAADYTFFCMISGKLLVWLLLATLVTYGTGRWLAAIPVRHSDLHGKALTRKKRGVLALGIVLILGALVTLKYLRVFGVTLAAPIGISYYSLQAISYMTDVYRGTQESCKNPIKVALYLSFFPQIMEGPISRFSETADALYGGNSIQFENLVFGYQRIIWGLFKKMVIADRLAPLVATTTISMVRQSSLGCWHTRCSYIWSFPDVWISSWEVARSSVYHCLRISVSRSSRRMRVISGGDGISRLAHG